MDVVKAALPGWRTVLTTGASMRVCYTARIHNIDITEAEVYALYNFFNEHRDNIPDGLKQVKDVIANLVASRD